MLVLKDVFYVPSLHRNLISISSMDKDGYQCHFGNGRCAIWLNDVYAGVAFLHNDLYLLSICEKVNSVCDVNVSLSSSENANKKRKRTHDTSSKLWHYRLGHISRGRIERLVKNTILPPLEFSDFEQCRGCTKGKYIKQIKNIEIKNKSMCTLSFRLRWKNIEIKIKNFFVVSRDD